MEAKHFRRLDVPSLVALLLFSLWVTSAFWSFSERQRLISARENELSKLTVAVEEQTLRLFKLTEVSIRAIAHWIEEHPKTFPAQDPSFIKLVGELRRISDGVLDVRLADSSGGVYVVPAASRQPVANVVEHKDIRAQLNPLTRGLYIGDPVISPVNNKWIVAVTYPVLKSDGELTIVAAVLELDRIARIFELQRDKPNGSITILKADGVTLFRAPAIEGAIGKSIAKAPDFIEHLSVIDRGQYRAMGAFDGLERLVSHARLTSYPLIIAVTASLDDALAPWHGELLKIIALLLFVTAATTLMMRRLLRINNESRQRLVESELRFRSLIEHAPEAILVIDPALDRVIDVNPKAEKLFQRKREALLSLSPERLFAPVQPGGVSAGASITQIVARACEGESVVIEGHIRTSTGIDVPVELRVDDMVESGRHLVGASFIDITERRKNERTLRLAASVFATTQEGIMIADADKRVVDVNEAFTRITGYARQDMLGNNPRLLSSGLHGREFYESMRRDIHSQGHWQGELWNRRHDGELYALRLTISVVKDAEGRVSHYVGVLSDITMEKRQKELLEKTAHYDALTGIPNRILLTDRMRQALAQTQRSRTLLAICYLDLDGFKPVNDTYGHEAGDRVLVEVAERLQSCLRGGDTVARLGGDEFVVLLLGLNSVEECEAALQRLLDLINEPLRLRDQIVCISASIGVSVFPMDDADPDTLLRHADQAMYQAKQDGKGRYQMFDLNALRRE